MADQLCTLAQVKARTEVTDTDDDALITELIEQVSAWVEGYTGRRFVPDNGATKVFDTEPGSVLRIPYGIRSVTSMGVNTLQHQPDSGGSYTAVPAADILLRPKPIDLPPGWPADVFYEVRISRGTLAGTVRGFGRIDNGATITGNFGFASVPLDIAAIALDAVVTVFNARQSGASEVIGAGDVAVTPWRSFFGKGTPQLRTLDRYRHWAVA